MELAAYREQAEAFVAELGDAYHRHYAGLDDGFAVEEIYARHAALFSREAVERLGEAAAAADDVATAGAGGEDAARRLRMLRDFAVEGHLGRATAALAERLAEREAGLRLDVGGTMLGFRESAVAQANEPDRERRLAIERARLEATAEALNPLHREALERTRELTAALGWPSYRALCAELKGLDLASLSRQTEAFLEATDAAYGDVLAPAVERTVGVPLARLARADLPWFFRARDEDSAFPAERLLGAYEATLAGMGLEATAGGRVLLDVEPRPRKSPRAFCVAVRAPRDVRLVVAPVGGRDDYVALLHEGGHAQHFAHVDESLAFEYRHLGDNAVTEAFAFLFDHLAEDPEWLRRRLGVRDDDGALAVHARAARLVYLRRYCAKLAYELVAHGEEPPGDALLADVYARALSGAIGVAWPTETHLADMDDGFYVAAYLRAWALETHLRRWLRDRFGGAWFEVPEAGAALRALWREGQRLTAEELLASLTGETLDFGMLAADLGLAPA
ncbi:hypothetical protein [Conexibacter arvalis]|uniref:Peptidase M3A/M3B catalytic domain-containing protein n=1 Tax=Conexibacter arvalis TaxID=912552 RepID=A0A840IJ21_9ACTN|nr:hypothetical protein [Conexibacter arvalis]MBB4665002.1 hypothetical protein [Conexibacter arvalis]